MLESVAASSEAASSVAEPSWGSIGEDPMVRDLAERMARSAGRSPEVVLSKLNFMARVVSPQGVLAVAREPLEEKELSYSAVLQRVRVAANSAAASSAAASSEAAGSVAASSVAASSVAASSVAASSVAVTSWESIGEDPMVRDLAERMARSSGRSPEVLLSKLSFMARVVSLPGVLAVAREPLDEKELVYSAVLQRVRMYADENTPRWNLCTGGATSLEISPNGFYGRCPKTGAKQEYMGDLRDDGPLKVLDPARDDLTCTIPCKKMMCFRNNVIRATDYPDFAVKMEQQGIRGNYNPEQRGHASKIFIRWKVTDVCNYTCAYCCDWRTVNAKGMEITDDEMMAAAGRMVSQFDAMSMRLTGGEPSSRRRYVDLMRLFHDNLDRFSDIEIRTNLSFQTKHNEVLNWDWKGKLHLHIGCHIRDKNFMPWRMVEVLQAAPNADYVLKFVSLPSIRPHIQFFIKYFVDNGIPHKNIKVVEENSGRKDVQHEVELEEAPKARKYLEERSKPVPVNAVAEPDVQAKSKTPEKQPVLETQPAKQAKTNGSAEPGVTRLTIDDLRALAQRCAERPADPAATVPPPGHTPLTETSALPPAALTTMTKIRRVIVGLSGPDRIAFSRYVVRALVRRAKARIPIIRPPNDGHSAGMGT